MELVAGQFYWVRGEGVMQLVAVQGHSAIVAGYDHTSDTFWGHAYLSADNMLRPATNEDVSLFKAAVQERMQPPSPTEHSCARCHHSETTTKAHCTKCGCGHEHSTWPPPGYPTPKKRGQTSKEGEHPQETEGRAKRGRPPMRGESKEMERSYPRPGPVRGVGLGGDPIFPIFYSPVPMFM